MSGSEVALKDCYFYLLYKRKGDAQTQIPILLDKDYDSATDVISASFEPTSYFTEKEGGIDIQVFACSTEQDFVEEDVDIEDVALWSTFNTQISVAKSQLKNSQTIVAEDMFTKGIAEMSAYLDAGSEEADAAEESASDAEEFARGTRSDGLTVPHASTGAHDNAKDYKNLAKDWASKIGGAVESGEYSAKYYAIVSDTRSQEAEAYAIGTKGGTPVPTFADKNAKDWATKTGSTVDGTNYSSKQYALNAKDSADIVSEHATAIDSIYADITNIDAVATDIQDEDSIINTVADNIQDVNAVAESITDVNTVAGKATQITTVAGIASNVTTVAGISSSVTTVAGISSAVSTVAGIDDEVGDVAGIKSDVTTVAGIASDVEAVADVDSDISTVATNISDVSAVATDIANVSAVAGDLTNIDAVAADLENIDDAVDYASLSRQYAEGKKLDGTDVVSGEAGYHNNAKYWADAVPALQAQVNANSARITNLEQTTKQDEQTVQYPDDGNYSSIMPDGVPARVAKYGEVAVIRGKSRGWNQLFKATNFVDFCSKVTDYQISISFDSSFSGYRIPMDTVPTINGHKYLIYIKADSGTNVRTAIYGIIPYYGETSLVNGVVSILTGDGNNCAVQLTPMTVGQAGSGNLYFIFRDVTNILSDWADADITTANIPLMIQQIPDLLKGDAYDAGSLVDTTVTGVEAIGFNRWDEEWEVGFYNPSDGAKMTANDALRSENKIKVAPSTQYYLRTSYTGSGQVPYVFFYDASENFISYTNAGSGENSFVFTTPQNAVFVTFALPNLPTPVAYNHDIQICLNSYADKTTYHPYQRNTLMLSTPVTLRSAGYGSTEVAEVLTLDTGKKTRPIKQLMFDADTAWQENSGVYYLSLSDGKVYSVNLDPSISFSDYEIVGTRGVAAFADKTCSIVAGTSSFAIRDDSYANLSAFKAGMVGKKFTYALATPLADEQVCDPIIDNYIEVEGGGTIRTIQSQSPVIDNCLDVTYDFIPV